MNHIYQLTLLAVLLTGCGPRLFDVNVDVTFDNNTDYDFTEAEVCIYRDIGDTVCTTPGNVLSGEGFTETLYVPVFNGDSISLDAYALDTDLDTYEQTYPSELITYDTTITINAVITLDDLVSN